MLDNTHPVAERVFNVKASPPTTVLLSFVINEDASSILVGVGVQGTSCALANASAIRYSVDKGSWRRAQGSVLRLQVI